jgi:hypothetical protein
MSFKKTALILMFSILLIPADAYAHHPSIGSGTGQSGPIETISAETMQKGRWAFELKTELRTFKEFSESELIGYAMEGKEGIHSLNPVFHLFLGAGYGLTEDFTVGFRIPYVYINDIREGHADEVHVHGDSKGIGDISINGLYRFLRIKDMDFASALVFGLKIPTGSTGAKDKGGERFEAEHQPGSGSWDPFMGISVTKKIGGVSLDANVLYKKTTEGAQDTDLGDVFNYNTAFSYRAVKKPITVDLLFEANGEWKQKQKTDGAEDENSGGNVVFLSPGIKFSWDKNCMAYLSFGFPVVQDLNGIQADAKYRGSAGLIYGF